MILAVERVFGEVRAGESCRSPLSLGSPRRLLAAPQRPQPLPRTSSSMPEGGPELEDIVRGTDERPFPPDLAHPAQQKLAEASPLLDLPKDRLHDGLAPSIQPPTGFGPGGCAACGPPPTGPPEGDRVARWARPVHGAGDPVG
jgi:hypothetical protein